MNIFIKTGMSADKVRRFFIAALVLTTLSQSKISYGLNDGATADVPPDFSALNSSAYLMGPGDASHVISDFWLKPATFMREVNVFDTIAARIEAVVCGAEQNKSVLVVGEPSLAYVYLFARIASNHGGSKCKSSMWHAEVNVSKIESGHRYVGDVDEYWNRYVLAPADRKDVVMYFANLGALVGIGSHSHDETGIEREYVANMTSGRLRTVAFMNKYEYNEMSKSRNAYVLEAFADRVILPPVDPQQAAVLAAKYMSVLYPNVTLAQKDLDYILKNVSYYQPNRQEPDRTFSVLNTMVRSAGDRKYTEPENRSVSVESKHPYDPAVKTEFFLEASEFDHIKLEFSIFDLASRDSIEIYDANSGKLLMTYSRMPTNGMTDFFNANSLKIVLNSVATTVTNQGFRITQIAGRKLFRTVFSREDARKAVMSVAQVPKWLIERDYRVIKDLQGKLDGDVVGVADGKKDLVRLAKNGYVAGRTDDKPIATTLLTGPTGTGKSYIAKKMADFMEMKLVTLDMTNYKDTASVKSFQEVMSRYLTNSPFAIYLFEEIDKASVEVLDQLYFMMDEGVFYDNYQRPLFARGAFIIMTSNAASDIILKNPNAPDLRSQVMTELRKSFRMSFLNRFDAVSIFKPFTEQEFFQLANVLASKKIQRLKDSFEWKATVDEDIIKFIATKGRSAEFGARPMERLIENTLGIGIAEFQLNKGAIPDGSEIKFQKASSGDLQFLITVNGQSVEYRVDPDNNGLFSQFVLPAELERFFKSIRLYND